MRFEQFAQFVEQAGLTAKDCGRGHWQIHGGVLLVNFYPKTEKGPRLYVQGMASGKSATYHQAIMLAKTGKGIEECDRHHKRDEPPLKYFRRVKKRLLAKDPHCYLCGAELTWQTATIDHFIPLGKGGGNGQDNLRLACEPCNTGKANKMPALTGKEI